ncbi:hypothetical protein [Tautonia plasticadhaerens]|uniref:MraY-like glycosyltransferase n=1 Tax=Tautonia plasticadhaerens TaxID=2527974 RepID=A0A518GZ10_9BACT|nr:hypothetical protein [Tautonia plasticadhaerens]QDV33838.1 MraY-like glycosyltransferase [Tautonia plasticadhaerens]
MNATTPDPARRWSLTIDLMVLSPMCAEYIIGYDTSTGDPAVLLGSLLIFAPLYGAPAVLIREAARRSGAGWPGIVALSAAFGILQAGVVDQSMFSESYREIDYWEALVRTTWIGPLGLSAYATMVFLVGHVIWSFCIPIALVESLSPGMADRPWLRAPGLILVGLLYLAAAALVLDDHLETERDHASAAQVAGSLGVAVGLAILGLAVCRPGPGDRETGVPGPLAVGVLGLVAAILYNLMPESWAGFSGGMAILAVGAATVSLWSRSGRWGRRHVIALATGVLMARALFGFLIEPLGDVPPVAKYSHNAGFLLGAALLGLWAWSRNRPVPTESIEDGDRVPA